MEAVWVYMHSPLKNVSAPRIEAAATSPQLFPAVRSSIVWPSLLVAASVRICFFQLIVALDGFSQLLLILVRIRSIKYIGWLLLQKTSLPLPSVTEPPKLYGPHAPVIVLKTFDCCTWEPDNPGSLSGVIGGTPNHPYFTTHTGSTMELLQHYSIWYKNNLHQSAEDV